MKSKQLANVLIKILGLSLCIQSVTHFITGIFNIFYATSTRMPASWTNFLSGAILAAIGIFLIIKSAGVARFLFKNEDDQFQIVPLGANHENNGHIESDDESFAFSIGISRRLVLHPARDDCRLSGLLCGTAFFVSRPLPQP